MLELYLYQQFIVYFSTVTTNPPGPLYLPIFTQTNITCSTVGPQGTLLIEILFSNMNPKVLEGREGELLGIATTYRNGTLSIITVNTSNTSLIGIRCVFFPNSSTLVESTTILTIYSK